jgi:2-polyprenyl-6-methoxyphenol hydroxylase-like FAD-dependent oxidoreductase
MIARSITPARENVLWRAMDLDALVVGGGPTGATMAAELLARGLAVRVIDKAAARSDKSRALVVQARSLELFQKMGIADELVARGRRTVRINWWVGERSPMQIDFAHVPGLDTPYPFLLFVSQAETERLLDARLAALGAKVERPVELLDFADDGDGVVARLRHEDGREESVRARWIVGCDGAHSVVRKQAGLRFEGAPYPSDFVLADVAVDSDLAEGELHLFLPARGLLALFPLPGARRFRVIAAPPEPPAHESDPTLDEVEAMARRLCPHELALRDPVWLARFRLHHRGVDRYRAGRAFVAGDAAHIHSPAGGQGMNTGIQDAWNLAWKLALVVRGQAPEALLDTYHAERHPVGQTLLRFTDRMFTLGTTSSALTSRLRNALVPLVAPQVMGRAGGRRAAFRFVSQLAVSYRGGPLSVENGRFHDGPRAGDRAPDGPLLVGGSETTLFTVMARPEFQLLLFSPATPDGALLPGSGALRVHTIDEQSDPRGELRTRYGARDGAVYVVRPDGYVAYRSAGASLEGARAYLDRQFPGLLSDGRGPRTSVD